MHDRAHAEIEPADMPRASEPGWADLLTELARFTAMPDRSKEETLLDAVGTVVRLRALVAERDARIATLEAGLQPFAEFHKTLLLYRRNDGAWHGISTVKAAWPDHKRVLYGEFPGRNELVTNYRELYPRHFREAARLFGLSAETR